MTPRAQNQYLVAALLIAVVLVHAVIQTTFFVERPDEWKAMPAFADFLFSIDRFYPLEEATTRILLLAFNLVVCGVLLWTRLITPRVFAFALIWPFTIFLFSKIYWEFYYFPLCLIRYDVTKKQEVGFIALLCGLFPLLGEANLLVLATFRSILLAQKSGFRWLAPIGAAAIGIAIGQIFSADLPYIGEGIARFGYVREIVNPEYTLLETFGALFVTMHFFTIHTLQWQIDAVFSGLVVLAIVLQPGFLQRVKEHRYVIAAILATVVGMSEVTHGFQSARYYFFFLPLLAYLTPVKGYPIIAALGVLHVAFKMVEV